MLTFEAEQFQGASGIIEKLKVGNHLSYSLSSYTIVTDNNCSILVLQKNLPFQKVQHKIVTLDAQPSSPTTASLMVLVTGALELRPANLYFIAEPC